MEFDISDMRNSGMLTILKILGINLLFIVVVLFLINHYVSPYLKLFINLQVGIKKHTAATLHIVLKLPLLAMKRALFQI